MRRFSTLAGPFQKMATPADYRVDFINVLSYDRRLYRYWARAVAYGAFAFVIIFGSILLQPSHWIITQQPDSPDYYGNLVMLACLVLLLAFMTIGTFSATRSTLKAKDPIVVRPPKKLRVAFATTRAPGEPIEMVRTTLQAAKEVRYRDGTVDVWLLDETADKQLKAMCKELSVHYFSRRGIPAWNTPKPHPRRVKRALMMLAHRLSFGKVAQPKKARRPNPFLAAKSKHGNFNAWRRHLAKKGVTYDILAGVDTDQVPEPNYLERLLGYFRDKDVAYAVGPQVYGNYGPGMKGLVARWAESQASFFQSTIQRAGNASNSPMFVGTNYAIRMSALDQIGGFQPCITEDMATGLAIHASKNPETGNRWKSVYTPDVLAIGEGPDYWAPYFTQQWRWAAGTFDTWKRMVWRLFYKLPPRVMLHYFLMLTYYPMTAVTWLLGVVSSMVYLTTGATAVIAPWNQFVSLYMMLVVMQLSLYFWNRRFNVSPHEPEGSYGVSGMVLSTITAPIYLSALIGIILGKKANFVVTTKGGSENPDRLPAFRTHLQWFALLTVGVTYGYTHAHSHPAMLVWVATLMIICLTPPILSLSLILQDRIKTLKARKVSNAPATH